MNANRKILTVLAALALGATACETEEPVAPPPEPEPEQQPAKAPVLTLDQLEKESAHVALTPSPTEMQVALHKHGIDTTLASLIKDRSIDVAVPSKDQAAVRTGVVIADLVLTVKEADKAKVLERLKSIREGLDALGAGQDASVTLEEIANQVEADAITRDKLVMRMDEISGAMIPEIEYEAGPQVVPLIQAGSWLEGANLVSNAIRTSGRYEAADALLLQPTVVEYFLRYVGSEGKDRAPDEVVDKLEETLRTLLELTRKETLTQEDVTTIHVSTDSVLALL